MKKLAKKWDLRGAFEIREAHVRRAAVFYEYARHSDEMIGFILNLREFEIFSKDPYPERTYPTPAIRERITKTLLQLHSIGITPDFLLFLTEEKRFPERPFEISPSFQRLFGKNPSLLGGIKFSRLPWKVAVKMCEEYNSLGRDAGSEMENQGIYVIGIPWKNRNEEIAAAFLEFLKQIRPADKPEPPNAGRKGRGGSFGTTDMLKQLFAYRLHKAGLDHLASEKRYSTAEGWSGAVESAKMRIDEMMRKPFFASS
jgi:hypothetical protein